MTSQYATPRVPADWASSRETHPAVAMAIHAISDDSRSPEAIWEAPTKDERDHVAMAVENYITNDVFEAEDDGRYPWGWECVVIGGNETMTTEYAASDLIICQTADGFSLHAPGSTDEQIACGDAPYLVSGEGRPGKEDFDRALALLAK